MITEPQHVRDDNILTHQGNRSLASMNDCSGCQVPIGHSYVYFWGQTRSRVLNQVGNSESADT